ncbi:DUF1330 domain-containing protein [Streptomyces sp. NPDC051642]|uniref:DUF1330 domain-containing protein n=1 Tax=Streptomyces sp. NPDC051642 TaxID=3154646 RepID=UPI0034318279
MPKGYVILTESIKDPAGMDAYSRAAGPSMAEGGASVLGHRRPAAAPRRRVARRPDRRSRM